MRELCHRLFIRQVKRQEWAFLDASTFIFLLKNIFVVGKSTSKTSEIDVGRA